MIRLDSNEGFHVSPFLSLSIIKWWRMNHVSKYQTSPFALETLASSLTNAFTFSQIPFLQRVFVLLHCVASVFVTNFKFLERGVNKTIVLVYTKEQCLLWWSAQYKRGSQLPFLKNHHRLRLYVVTLLFYFLQMHSCSALAFLQPFF